MTTFKGPRIEGGLAAPRQGHDPSNPFLVKGIGVAGELATDFAKEVIVNKPTREAAQELVEGKLGTGGFSEEALAEGEAVSGAIDTALSSAAGPTAMSLSPVAVSLRKDLKRHRLAAMQRKGETDLEFYARAGVSVRDKINQFPGLAGEIRKIYKEELGFDPYTTEITSALEAEATAREKKDKLLLAYVSDSMKNSPEGWKIALNPSYAFGKENLLWQQRRHNLARLQKETALVTADRKLSEEVQGTAHTQAVLLGAHSAIVGSPAGEGSPETPPMLAGVVQAVLGDKEALLSEELFAQLTPEQQVAVSVGIKQSITNQISLLQTRYSKAETGKLNAAIKQLENYRDTMVELVDAKKWNTVVEANANWMVNSGRLTLLEHPPFRFLAAMSDQFGKLIDGNPAFKALVAGNATLEDMNKWMSLLEVGFEGRGGGEMINTAATAAIYGTLADIKKGNHAAPDGFIASLQALSNSIGKNPIEYTDVQIQAISDGMATPMFSKWFSTLDDGAQKGIIKHLKNIEPQWRGYFGDLMRQVASDAKGRIVDGQIEASDLTLSKTDFQQGRLRLLPNLTSDVPISTTRKIMEINNLFKTLDGLFSTSAMIGDMTSQEAIIHYWAGGDDDEKSVFEAADPNISFWATVANNVPELASALVDKFKATPKEQRGTEERVDRVRELPDTGRQEGDILEFDLETGEFK
jgi:hypothetical protein